MNLLKYFSKFRRELYKTLSKLCLKKASMNYCGLQMKVPILHGLGAGLLVQDDKWMSDCLSVFLKEKDGVVVDVGVNIGLYLVKLKALDATRDYIGFEPNAVCNYYTEELIRANDFKSVRIFPFALSDKKELRTFYIRRKADKMGSLNHYARFGEIDKYAFDLFTFQGDEFFEIIEPVALCVFKIDVEGAELEVLRGLISTIKKYTPFVYCEIWQLPEKDHPTYHEKLERLILILKLIEGIDYKVLGVSEKDAFNIKVLNTLEDFDGSHRRDYILVHKSEAASLLNKLAQI